MRELVRNFTFFHHYYTIEAPHYQRYHQTNKQTKKIKNSFRKQAEKKTFSNHAIHLYRLLTTWMLLLITTKKKERNSSVNVYHENDHFKRVV